MIIAVPIGPIDLKTPALHRKTMEEHKFECKNVSFCHLSSHVKVIPTPLFYDKKIFFSYPTPFGKGIQEMRI